MAVRIHIEDAENNFLYLNVDLPRDELEPVLEALNRYSDGTAKIERELLEGEDPIELAIASAEADRRRFARRPSSSIRSAARDEIAELGELEGRVDRARAYARPSSSVRSAARSIRSSSRSRG